MAKLCFYLSVAVVLSVAVGSVKGLSCLQCPPEPCEPPTGCEYGVGRWGCLCCDECLRGPGDICGGPWYIRGICGTGLKCRLKYPDNMSSDGICVPKTSKTSTSTTESIAGEE